MSLTDFKALGRRYHPSKVAAVGFEPTPPDPLTDFKALGRRYHPTKVAMVGFEPTLPERLEPKSSALDCSATLPHCQV